LRLEAPGTTSASPGSKLGPDATAMQEGKLYEVLDGDIIFFKFNVTASKK
jgi:ribosome-binding ATPase YchF (GTP1/OBG family)